MKAAFLRNKIVLLLLTGDTRLVRLWVSLLSLLAAVIIATNPDVSHTRWSSSSALGGDGSLVLLFFTHAAITFYGVYTCRFSVLMLWCEAGLGLFLWGGLAATDLYMNHVVGPMTGAGLITLFIWSRYPTHNKGPQNAAL